MNVCRNGVPMEEGAWVRRSGTHFAATTLNGAAGRVIPFAFEQASPYMMEFTNGFIRMFASSTQTTGLLTPLPKDFRLVTTNDNVTVLDVNNSSPANVHVASPVAWATGDQIMFLFDASINASYVPLARNRVFKIAVANTTNFTISDPITGAPIDGSSLGWTNPPASGIIAVRILAIQTPYTAGSWATVRKVQAETDAVLLQGSFAPRKLSVVTLPTASAFGTFTLTTPLFTDGPYLDPPTDGTVLTPSISAVTQGALPVVGSWTGIAWSSTLVLFAAVNSNTTAAATSADGIAWTARVLPATVLWSAVAWNGTVFAAIASGTSTNAATTISATSADGITWTQRVCVSGHWSAIAWNGTVFCAVQSSSATAMTSPDGITWTSRTLPASASWTSIAWNGTVFAAIGFGPNIVATSPDGITWTQRVLPVSNAWQAIAWNGTVFAAVGGFPSDIAVTSPDGITWTLRTMPSPQSWSALTANGAGLFVAVSNSNASATSPDGITWTTRAMPANISWDAIAWNGTVFCAIAYGSALTSVTATGSFSTVTVIASSLSSINKGQGFLSTDIGRQIRLRSEPLPWIVTTAYVAGNAVIFNGVYYKCIAGTTGDQPDISPSKWSITPAAARWTWGIIASITNPSTAVVSLSGLDLLYTTQITTWRLGVYSATTGYPSCGVYYEGRLWLSGAVGNRIDAGVSNQLFNMAPTLIDGTVTDNSAISYTFNSDDVNPIFWMVGTKAGIVAGTQAGEWLISAPTTGPITPTNIQAQHGTHYGCANIEPEPTEITISFVQRFVRKVLEYFPDVFSGRYIAPNLTQYAKHLTTPGIAEIRYQQELLPVLWSRCVDGTLIGASYKRSSLFSSQPPDFIGWHRHDLGSERDVESIAVGPSADGTLDTLAMVTNDAEVGVRHVEFMESVFDVDSPITSGWFCDDAIVPSGGTIVAAGVNSTLTFYGLWHLNGETVTVWCGGIDVGDFTVASGAVTVPIDNDVAGIFTSAYLLSISSTTAYGAKATLIDSPYGRITVPAVVGFTYTSQGQVLRPDWQEGNMGTSQAKPGRIHQFGGLLAGCQGISFGTSFSRLHSANFKKANGTALTALELFTGVYWETVDDDWNFDSMLCWEISRPYPSGVASISGFIQTTQR